MGKSKEKKESQAPRKRHTGRARLERAAYRNAHPERLHAFRQ